MVIEMHSMNPNQVTYLPWIRCIDESNFSRWKNHDGKWMMFFSFNEINSRWREACELYNTGKLIGINSMKVSTAKQNNFKGRLHGPNEFIIIFYCGPSEDREIVLTYGRNLLNNMRYDSRPFIHYKSDKPHLINYGSRYRELYSINTQDHYNRNRSNLNPQIVLPILTNHNFTNIISYGSISKPDTLGKIAKATNIPYNGMRIGSKISNNHFSLNNIIKPNIYRNLNQINKSSIRTNEIKYIKQVNNRQNGLNITKSRFINDFYEPAYTKTVFVPSLNNINYTFSENFNHLNLRYF